MNGSVSAGELEASLDAAVGKNVSRDLHDALAKALGTEDHGTTGPPALNSQELSTALVAELGPNTMKEN